LSYYEFRNYPLYILILKYLFMKILLEVTSVLLAKLSLCFSSSEASVGEIEMFLICVIKAECWLLFKVEKNYQQVNDSRF